MKVTARKYLHLLLNLLILLQVMVSAGSPERLRVMIETDAGGDPDDEQSLVRFLLYSNEWDVEGIIANRSEARAGENRNVERTGLGIVRRLVNAYGQCYTNLVKHDDRYPQPEVLLARTVSGYAGTDDGLELILKAVDAADPRPLWFMNWGTDAGSAPSCLKRALDKVLKERGEKGYGRFKERLRLSSDDQFGEHTSVIKPAFPLWVDTFRPPMEGKRWYHRFSAITARAGGFDLERDVLSGHGPLGALYPTNTTHWQKEGDTMTFLYLVPTGMNDPDQPISGSWAGRYGLREDAGGNQYYWANQLDSWNGKINRDNILLRWAADLQNDFRARLDWCVKPKSGANHKPIAVLNGDTTTGILTINASAGSSVKLSAKGSIDPDGNSLVGRWSPYPEASTYKGEAVLHPEDSVEAKLSIPEEAAGKSIHVLLTLRDNGTPPLAAYRRAIVWVEPTP